MKILKHYRIIINFRKQKEETKTLLKSVPLLSSLSEYQLFTLSHLLKEVTFEDKEYIIHKGDKGDSFYIIKTGCAICYDEISNKTPVMTYRPLERKKTVNKNLVEVRKLYQNDYFGEIALLEDIKRTLNVISEGITICWKIERDIFNKYIGSIKDALDVFYL